jgi:hypothetical protein
MRRIRREHAEEAYAVALKRKQAVMEVVQKVGGWVGGRWLAVQCGGGRYSACRR